MEVTIPKGTDFGEVLKVQGNGMPRLGKKGFGDLLINVKIEVLKKPTAKQKELLVLHWIPPPRPVFQPADFDRVLPSTVFHQFQ